MLPSFILNYLSERMEMAHFVQGRIPYLDHHLAKVVARMPVDMKGKGMKEKMC